MKNDQSIKHLTHDLNNIFTRILNSVDLLKRKIKNYDSILPLLNNIEAGTFLASEMVEDTFGTDSKKTRSRKVNLNSIIRDVVRSLELQHKNKIDFQLILDANLKLISGMYSDFYRLILNLITNSIEAIEKNGTVSIVTDNLKDNNNIELKIKDNGSGISELSLSRIYDESFSTKNKENISGLGLSIVKKIVDEYDGTISVSSKVSLGTEFIITLPAVQSFNENQIEGGKTILVAEDENILRNLLTDLLESYNYTVLTSSNGKDVLDQLKIRIPDLLIIDQQMPELDGLTCINEIKRNNYRLPIILASGSSTGINDVPGLIIKTINKPYNFDELFNLIRGLIG